MIYVPGTGPSNAKLVVVGEAPGQHEEEQLTPFVGPTGKMTLDCLTAAGTSWDEVYRTNVVKIRPPGNDIHALHILGKTVEDFLPQLYEEIIAIQPNCILALGNTALTALTGYHGIEKYRGSILPYIKGQIKVVPSLHPASILHRESSGKMRSWKDLTFIKWDVIRAVAQSKFKEFDLPRRQLDVCHSSLDLYRFVDRYSKNRLVSVDIETFKTIPICIALAFNKTHSISIPLFNTLSESQVGMGKAEQLNCWKIVAEVLADPSVMKIGQNFKFDESLLDTCVDGTLFFGMLTRSFWFDTHLAFRTLYPELLGKLEFIASVLTEEPYWKDEGKEFNPKKDKIDKLLLYNAKDAAVTFECYEKELEELRARDLEDFFFERVMPLHPFYSRVEKRGILRDSFQQKFLHEKYWEQLKEILLELGKLIAPFYDFDPNKVELINQKKNDGLLIKFNDEFTYNFRSNTKQVPELIFGVLKCPIRKGVGEEELDGLMRNIIKDPIKKRILQLHLDARKVDKTLGTYVDSEVSFDGKSRTAIRIMLETGRTSTSVCKPPITTHTMGLAFQTITKYGDIGSDIRSMYTPDPGYIFIEPDLSQAEARVVAILARDEKLLTMFKYGVDIHRITAGWILNRAPILDEFFEKPSKEYAESINKLLKSIINETERQLGKKFRHAGHYDMGKREASIQAGISEKRAGIVLDMFHKTNPNIRDVFHAEIIQTLKDNQRELKSPHGRARQFLNKWGPDLFKEAYANIPQATVSDHLKFAAQRIEKRTDGKVEILQESHDSFLSQVKIEYVDNVIPIIIEELETPIDFARCSLPRGLLTIPCSIKLGDKNWEEMKTIYG